MIPSQPANAGDSLKLWERLSAALARSAPAVLHSLRPPLGDQDENADWIRDVASDGIGIAAAYFTHDGSRRAGGVLSRLPTPPGAPWTRAAIWMPARAARAEQDRLASIQSYEVRNGLFALGRVGTYRPTSAYEAEEQYCLAVAIKSGELFAITYDEHADTATRTSLGITWIAYIERLVLDLESSTLEAASPDQYGVLRLVERQAKAGPTAPPRQDADVLIHLLRERRLLAIEGEPSRRLVESVGKALRARSEEKRISGLRAAFDDCEEVEDDFADNEQLSALAAMVRGDR